MAEPFDLVIHNARIVDGTGNPYYPGHIALSQGRIVKIDPRIDSSGAKKIIDADGLVACPASTYLAALLPPSVQAGGYAAYAEKLKDPHHRKMLVEEIENGGRSQWENFIKAAGFEGLVISIAQKNVGYIGKSIAEIARLEGKDPYDVFFDLVVEEGEGVNVIIHAMDEQDVQRILKSPLTMIGSDGFPDFGDSQVHPRQTGTFPRILGRYVREQGLIRLEEAIRKMTSLPAQTFRVQNKGLLKNGFDADIVIFDPGKILDKATFDDPRQKPQGIAWVLVNGEVAVEAGRVTGASHGRVLRRRHQGTRN